MVMGWKTRGQSCQWTLLWTLCETRNTSASKIREKMLKPKAAKASVINTRGTELATFTWPRKTSHTRLGSPAIKGNNDDLRGRTPAGFQGKSGPGRSFSAAIFRVQIFTFKNIESSMENRNCGPCFPRKMKSTKFTEVKVILWCLQYMVQLLMLYPHDFNVHDFMNLEFIIPFLLMLHNRIHIYLAQRSENSCKLLSDNSSRSIFCSAEGTLGGLLVGQRPWERPSHNQNLGTLSFSPHTP